MFGIGTTELLIILGLVALVAVPPLVIGLGLAIYWLFKPRRNPDEPA
jgi:hypothetical protein